MALNGPPKANSVTATSTPIAIRQSLAVAFPLRPGKAAALRAALHEAMGPRRREFDAAQRRAGIRRDLRWIQSTPGGDFAVRYLEADDPVAALTQRATSTDSFDQWMAATVRDAAAIDPYALVHQARPIVDVETHQAGGVPVAFAVPIQPGKAARNLEWAKAFRLEDPHFAAMIGRATVHRERVWQYETPQLDYSVLFFEAADPGTAFGDWAAGQGTFEKRLRKEILDIHGVDLSKPAPPPEMVLDWKAIG